MPGIVLKLFVIGIGIVLIAFVAANAFRNARRLNGRIREFKAEQAEQRGPINPYAALAELYSEDARQREEASRPRSRKRP